MSLNLLIVDDSELVRASLRRLCLFTAQVSTIREVGTLSDAMAEIQLNPPTLVILDLNMPDGFGMDIIQRIKVISPITSIAVVTIHADPEYRQRCLALGAGWFFDKVTELGPLLELVRQLARMAAMINSNLDNMHE